MTGNRRLFFALWPDGATRKTFSQLCKQHTPGKARPVAWGNLHATLIFLGNQKEASLAIIQQAAGLVRADAFQLLLNHMEIWKRSQVLNLCPSRVPEPLTQLHTALKQALDEAGIETEARPYRPHVTLARKLRRKIPLAEIVPIEWSVHEFVLLESVFEKESVRYQLLDRWRLKD